MWYRREGAALTAITEATLAALTTAHTDGGFLHIDDGYYRLDLPDAAYASGANYVEFGGTVPGMIVVGGMQQLINVDLEDSVRQGLTALPNAAAQAAGGLFTRGTGAGQINQDGNGRIDVNIEAISADSAVAATLESYLDGTALMPVRDQAIDEGTAQSATATTLVLKAASAYADDVLIGNRVRIVSATAGAGQTREITDNVLATDTVTVPTWTVTPTGTIVYQILPSIQGASGLDAAGVRAAVGLASANLDTQLSTIDTVVDAILVDTGTTLDARIPAALVGGRMDVTVDATGMESGAIDAILDDTIGDGTITVRQALRVILAAAAGKLSGAATTTVTIRNVADTANVIVATVDGDGNRSATTVTP